MIAVIKVRIFANPFEAAVVVVRCKPMIGGLEVIEGFHATKGELGRKYTFFWQVRTIEVITFSAKLVT